MASNESWKSNAKKASGGHTLQNRGISKKGKALKDSDELYDSPSKSYKAENMQKANPRMGDRGPGSSAAYALLREEAMRLRAQRKIPGNLGYQQPVDVSRYGKYSCSEKKGKK